ncbi:MAG: hypothetical protein DMG65_01820 [Candidatus Angelobacter sp. Gp1-AA117]|nr:MAG: hypothetical protein DMG65_01820 [Candidatus Angelobacter sp. Gp1-AA117]
MPSFFWGDMLVMRPPTAWIYSKLQSGLGKRTPRPAICFKSMIYQFGLRMFPVLDIAHWRQKLGHNDDKNCHHQHILVFLFLFTPMGY